MWYFAFKLRLVVNETRLQSCFLSVCLYYFVLCVSVRILWRRLMFGSNVYECPYVCGRWVFFVVNASVCALAPRLATKWTKRKHTVSNSAWSFNWCEHFMQIFTYTPNADTPFFFPSTCRRTTTSSSMWTLKLPQQAGKFVRILRI